jgi:hypothetical protein
MREGKNMKRFGLIQRHLVSKRANQVNRFATRTAPRSLPGQVLLAANEAEAYLNGFNVITGLLQDAGEGVLWVVAKLSSANASRISRRDERRARKTADDGVAEAGESYRHGPTV